MQCSNRFQRPVSQDELQVSNTHSSITGHRLCLVPLLIDRMQKFISLNCSLQKRISVPDDPANLLSDVLD